jgi:nicotinate phosphoribosyltransferase
VAEDLGDRLWGVRLDTSEALEDEALKGTGLRGVQPALVEKVRGALDAQGFEHVRIVVSGGFNADKIRAFEDAEVPVDAYGVGSSLLRGQNDFTADVVEVDGRPVAKVGRGIWPNPRLEPVA